MLINNAMIYVNHKPVKDAKGVVIVTHGIALHTTYYEEVRQALSHAGYHVFLYDVRGHGKSQGPRGDIKHLDVFIDDLHTLIEKVRQTYDLPIYLLGHSMGGVITNVYATTYDDYDGTIIMSAPTNSQGLGILKILPYSWMGWLRIKTDFKDTRLSHLPFSDDVDPYALKSFTLRLIGNVLVRGISRIHKHLNRYTKPVLLLHGGADVLVPPKMSEQFYQMLPSKNKTIKIYPDGYHNLNHDIVTEQVLNDIVNWLDEKTMKKAED